MTEVNAARQDWEQRIGQASDAAAQRRAELAAPGRLHATGGTGHVRLDWPEVEGAVGYLVHRADAPSGPFEPLDHGGGDVLAVPYPPYADSRTEPGRTYWYRIAAWTDDGPGPLDGPVACAAAEPAGDEPARIAVTADAAAAPLPMPAVWNRMLGTEHFSLLNWQRPGPGGHDVAAEFAAALGIVRDELGVRTLRAHGTFLPENVAVRADGTFDFSGLGATYDRLLALGVRPVVELSFMPRELAARPDSTVFQYGAINSVPADWGRWAELCREVTRYLQQRYGPDEVATWAFEVWNEANLEVFWTGTRDDYLTLYEHAARAVKSVDERIRVGGPASAAASWVGILLDFCRDRDVPVDFVSTHTYGNAPVDFRPLTRAFAARSGRPEPEVLWTEWGVTPTHFHPVNDSVFAAPFVLRGMKAALTGADALAYWVASDHFEELGWPPRLFHGGFGLLSVGNLRKPRFWALYLLHRLIGGRVPAQVEGDGAEALTQSLATRAADGSSVDVLVWNGTLDQGRIETDAELGRAATVRVEGLEPGRAYDAELHRVDAEHGNVHAAWLDMGAPDWPGPEQWKELRAADTLPGEHLGPLTADAAGSVQLEVELPMPAIRALRLTRL